MEKSTKLSKQALSYIESSLMESIYDCSDSMHDAEITKAKFNALADDEFRIEDYINEFHLDEYIESLKSLVKDNTGEVTNWEEFLKSTPSRLPIPYEKIKDKLN